MTLVTDNPEVTNFPTDYQKPLEGFCSIFYSQQYWKVTKVLPSIYDAENIQGKGIPYIITERAGKWYVYFIPDQDYTMQLYYLKDYAALQDDSDTNDFTEEAPALMRYDALSRLYGELKQDEKMEAYYTARAQAEFDVLKQQTQSRQRTGYLEIEQI